MSIHRSFGLRVATVIDVDSDEAALPGDYVLRVRIADASIPLFDRHRPDAPPFAEICIAAEVSRTTGYRLFRGGTSSLREYHDLRTVSFVIRRIRVRTRGSNRPVTFGDAIVLGLRGVIEGLRDDPWMSRVLKPDARMVAGLLLDRGPESLLMVLTDYVARCAATWGSSTEDARDHAFVFVWEILSAFLRQLPSTDGGNWPDPDKAQFDSLVSGPVEMFLSKLKDDGRTKSSLAIPEIAGAVG